MHLIDERMLLRLVRDELGIDELYGVDLHDEASRCAATSGRDEPCDDDYIEAIRKAMNAYNSAKGRSK